MTTETLPDPVPNEDTVLPTPPEDGSEAAAPEPEEPLTAGGVAQCLAWGAAIMLGLYFFPFEATFRVILGAAAFDYWLTLCVGAGLIVSGACVADKNSGKAHHLGFSLLLVGIASFLICGIAWLGLSQRSAPIRSDYEDFLNTPQGQYSPRMFDEGFMKDLEEAPTAEVWLDKIACRKFVEVTPANPKYYRFTVNGQDHPTIAQCKRGLNVVRWDALPGGRTEKDTQVTGLGSFD